MNTLQTLAHYVAHWLGWNQGDIESRWENGRLMIGFRCATCLELTDWHDAIETDYQR
jgi:hypothetical protein